MLPEVVHSSWYDILWCRNRIALNVLQKQKVLQLSRHFGEKPTCFRCRAFWCRIIGEFQKNNSAKQQIFRKITGRLKNPLFASRLVFLLDAGVHQKLVPQFIYPSTRKPTSLISLWRSPRLIEPF